MKQKITTSKIEIRVTLSQKNEIKGLAKTHGLSTSEYMRQAALTQEVKNAAEIETVIKLAKINADLARLGNLFKLALDIKDNIEIKRLVKDIRNTQEKLKEAVLKI